MACQLSVAAFYVQWHVFAGVGNCQLCKRIIRSLACVSVQLLAKVDGGLRPEQIDMVLLVGRATRMPRLQSLLTTYLDCDPCKLIYEVGGPADQSAACDTIGSFWPSMSDLPTGRPC